MSDSGLSQRWVKGSTASSFEIIFPRSIAYRALKLLVNRPLYLPSNYLNASSHHKQYLGIFNLDTRWLRLLVLHDLARRMGCRVVPAKTVCLPLPQYYQ